MDYDLPGTVRLFVDAGFQADYRNVDLGATNAGVDPTLGKAAGEIGKDADPLVFTKGR